MSLLTAFLPKEYNGQRWSLAQNRHLLRQQRRDRSEEFATALLRWHHNRHPVADLGHVSMIGPRSDEAPFNLDRYRASGVILTPRQFDFVSDQAESILLILRSIFRQLVAQPDLDQEAERQWLNRLQEEKRHLARAAGVPFEPSTKGVMGAPFPPTIQWAGGKSANISQLIWHALYYFDHNVQWRYTWRKRYARRLLQCYQPAHYAPFREMTNGTLALAIVKCAAVVDWVTTVTENVLDTSDDGYLARNAPTIYHGPRHLARERLENPPTIGPQSAEEAIWADSDAESNSTGFTTDEDIDDASVKIEIKEEDDA